MALTTTTAVTSGFHSPLSPSKSNFSSHCFLSYMEPYIVDQLYLSKNSRRPSFGSVSLSQPVHPSESKVDTLSRSTKEPSKSVEDESPSPPFQTTSPPVSASSSCMKKEGKDRGVASPPPITQGYEHFKALLRQLVAQSEEDSPPVLCSAADSSQPFYLSYVPSWRENGRFCSFEGSSQKLTPYDASARSVNAVTSKTISLAEKRAETFLRFLLRLEEKSCSSTRAVLAHYSSWESKSKTLAPKQTLSESKNTIVHRMPELNTKFGETSSPKDSISASSKIQSAEGNYSTGISEWSSLDAAHYSSEESEESYTLAATIMFPTVKETVQPSMSTKSQTTVSDSLQSHPSLKRDSIHSSSTLYSMSEIINASKVPPSTESLLLPPPPPPCVSYEEFTPVCSGDLLTSNTERAQTRSDKKFSITGLLPEEERMPQEAATHHLILKWESLDAGYVEMAGTFSNPPWQKHFPLKFCPDLCCHWIDIHEATSSDFPDISGRHQFKYIVDGQWMCNPSLLICDDGNHNLNNVVVIVPEALMRQTARRYRPTPAQRVGATVRPVRSNETASSGYLLPSAYREDVGKLGAAVCTPLEYTCNSASLSSVVLPSLSSPTLVKDVIASSTTHRNVKNRIRRSPCIESRSCKPLPDSKDKTEQAGSVRIKTTELEENVDLNAFNASSSFAEQVPFPLYLPAAAANKSGTMKRCAAVQDLCRNAPKELQVKEDSLFTQNGMQSKTLSTLVDISLDLHPGNGSLYSTFTPSPLHRKDHAAEIIPSLWNAAFSQNSDENAGESMAFLPPPLSSSPVAFLPPSPPSSSAPSFARNEQHPSTAPPYGLVAQYPPQETFVEAPSLTVAYPVFESTKGGASSCGEEGDNLFKIHSASTAHKPQILMDISSIEPSQKEFQSLPAPTPYPVASSSHQRRTVPATRYGSSIPTLNRCNSAYANGRTFDILRDNLRRVSSMTAGSWPAAVTELLHRPESLLNLDVPENIRGTTGLTLHYGGNMIPHPEKLNDGADAYFSTPIEGKNSVCVGVADGVGEWESIGLNPRLFAEELMQGCSEAFLNYNGDESAIEEKAMNILQRGYDSTRSFGSSTALIVCLDEKGERIGVSNLGDSTMILLHPQRSDNMSCVYRTKEQQHQFNCPYQLSRLPKPEDYEALKAEGKDLLVRVLQKSTMLPQDTPVMASSCELKVTEGDLIILGTDGVFDNLYDFEICDLANLALSPFEGLLVQRPDMITSPRTLATAIAEAASYRSKDMAAKTPFMKHARECGTNYIGGKLDDITVVACWVTRK